MAQDAKLNSSPPSLAGEDYIKTCHSEHRKRPPSHSAFNTGAQEYRLSLDPTPPSDARRVCGAIFFNQTSYLQGTGFVKCLYFFLVFLLAFF